MKYLPSPTGMLRYAIGALCLTLIASLGLAQDKNQKPAQQPAQQPVQQQPKQPSQTLPQPKLQLPQGKGRTPLYARDKVTLSDLNVNIAADSRIIAMMAALNAAGYDYEPGNRQLSALRQQLRTDLQNINPSLARRLRDYFQSHRKGRSDAAAVAPYLSLALTLTAPPVFSIDGPVDRLPEDVREITDFALLLEEFYRDTKFNLLMPKYAAAYLGAVKTYGLPTAQVISDVIAYLHTEPILELPPQYVQRPAQSGKKQPGEPLQLANRERHFVVIPDLLNASNAVNLRVVRDSYYILIGPAVEPGDAVRRAFLRFVIDPLMERQVKEVAAIRSDLRDLLKSRGDKVDTEYQERSAYFLLADSLSQAIDARLDMLEELSTRSYKDEKELKTATDEKSERAIYELSFAYERGAVLVYNFYDKMSTAEGAGVNIQDYLGSLLVLSKGDFDRESKRLDEYAARIKRYKEVREAAAANAPSATTLISNSDEQVVKQLDEADRLIRAEQYAAARAVLENIRQQRPNNARALFGLAEVGSKMARTITDKDRLDEELYASVQLYKEAASNASPQTEKWLIQRSYVSAAKILDFLEQKEDASAAYDLAIKLGDVAGGAFQEAQKAVQERQEKKP